MRNANHTHYRVGGSKGKVLPRTFSVLVCALLIALLTVYSGLAGQFLPAKFFLDQSVLLQYTHVEGQCDFLLHRDSFACTDLVYRVTGINEYIAPWISGALIGFLYFGVPLVANARVSVGRSTLFGFFLAFSWACIAATFNAGLNKELLALTFICLAALSIVRGKNWLALLWLLVYAASIRSYWVLMLCTSIAVWFASLKFSPRMAVLAALACLFGMVVLYYAAFGVSIGNLRQAINDSRVNDVSTAIVPFIQETSLPKTVADMVLILISLLLPFKLLLSGSVAHAVAGLLVSVTVFFCWRVLCRASDARSRSGALAVSLVFGLIVVQCLFEPDYGSFIRHISDFVPFVILAERLVVRDEAIRQKIERSGTLEAA